MLKESKVLLIEGEKDSANYIISLLKEMNCKDFNIVHKKTMADSLECVESEKDIDIILLDLILPNSKGIHAFEAIKAIEDCENIPVVIISNDKEIGIESIKKGAQDFIPKKDLTFDQLMRSLRYAIERKRNEINLRKTQERLRMALDATSDGIWDYDVKNNHIYFSDKYEKMLGYEAGTLTGGIEKIIDIMHPEDREKIMVKNIIFLTNKEESIYNDNIYKDEIRLKDVNGIYRWFLIRSMNITNGDDIPLRLVGVLVDITNRKVREIDRETSFDNLNIILEEKLQQWNEESQYQKVEHNKKLDRLTDNIMQMSA